MAFHKSHTSLEQFLVLASLVIVFDYHNPLVLLGDSYEIFDEVYFLEDRVLLSFESKIDKLIFRL